MRKVYWLSVTFLILVKSGEDRRRRKYDRGDKQYLVIEEINRGNCAQIFGDLFQLLDRNDYGFSDYPIKADADMKRQLQKAFAGFSIVESTYKKCLREE